VETSYDLTTDSLCVEVRPLPAHRTVEIEEDATLDLREEGEAVGYDVQHASQGKELVAGLVLNSSRLPQGNNSHIVGEAT
jgi:uncharacterized protein YuzE